MSIEIKELMRLTSAHLVSLYFDNNRYINVTLKLCTLLKDEKVVRNICYNDIGRLVQKIIERVPTYPTRHLLFKLAKRICHPEDFELIYEMIGSAPLQYRYKMIKNMLSRIDMISTCNTYSLYISLDVKLLKLLSKYIFVDPDLIISIYRNKRNHLNNKMIYYYFIKIRGNYAGDLYGNYIEHGYYDINGDVYENKIYYYKHDITKNIKIRPNSIDNGFKYVISDSKKYTKEKLRYMLITQILRSITTKNMGKLISYFAN